MTSKCTDISNQYTHLWKIDQIRSVGTDPNKIYRTSQQAIVNAYRKTEKPINPDPQNELIDSLSQLNTRVNNLESRTYSLTTSFELKKLQTAEFADRVC